MGAPISEEAIKILPLLFPPLLGWVRTRGAALWAGLFLGIGFGLGEIWYLAWSIARLPDYAGLAWWQFTGFLNERVLVTFIHGALTGIVATGMGRGVAQGWLHYLYAVALHAFTNIGALLFQMDEIPMRVAALWILLPFTLLGIIFMRMYQASRRSEGQEEPLLYRSPAP
ncbi:MAG: hypothetical protein ACOY94_23450 [Bacillota bacterium]